MRYGKRVHCTWMTVLDAGQEVVFHITQVGVDIDQTGHHRAAAGINDSGVSRDGYLTRPSHCPNALLLNQHYPRTVWLPAGAVEDGGI